MKMYNRKWIWKPPQEQQEEEYEKHHHLRHQQHQHQNGMKVKVMSFNILAKRLATEHYRDLYCSVPWKFIDWTYRKERLLEEVTRYEPKILCLQEVDSYIELERDFKKLGYAGTFIQRRDYPEGCAMFWKFSCFDNVNTEYIDFSKFNLRNNVAQVACLRDITSGRKLIVANIHVLFNPQRGDIKLAQIRLLFDSVQKMATDQSCKAVVICGDFNSVPGSALYKFISTGSLDCLQYNRKSLSGQVEGIALGLQSKSELKHESHIPHPDDMSTTSDESARGSDSCLENAKGKKKRKGNTPKANNYWGEEHLKIAFGDNPSEKSVLAHSLDLCSAYAEIYEEPEYTSAHRRFVGTVDYIWYTGPSVKPLKILLPFALQSLASSEIQCLPNQYWGSDHMSVLSEFLVS